MRRPSFLALCVLLAPAVAAAHVRITSPTPRTSAELKDQHCGVTGSPRANVQTLRPGSSLHLVWDEYIVHPGWFRISFQQNGDTFELPPLSNGKTGAGAPSNYPTEDLTGKTDPGTGSFIIADRIVHGTLSKDVMLPNVECNNCTLQLIQMMTDKPPYSIDVASDDIYFACVDLVLSATAPVPDAGGGTGPDAGSPDAGAGAPAGGTGGGCSAAGGSTGILAFAMVGLLRRRRAARRATSLS
jgi:uncharacterized protein (TIGR03382 family)